LARIGDKRGLPVFVEILQSSPDEDVRQAAAVHIYRFQDPSVVKELERTLNLDKGAWVREAAASSLYRLTGVRHNYKDASGNEVPFVP
jgi:HEAT repeat protein